MVWRETWTMFHPLHPAAGAVRRLQLFMDLLCVGHLSNRETSAPQRFQQMGKYHLSPLDPRSWAWYLEQGEI